MANFGPTPPPRPARARSFPGLRPGPSRRDALRAARRTFWGGAPPSLSRGAGERAGCRQDCPRALRRGRSTVLGRHHQIASAPPPRSALRFRRPRKIPFDDMRGKRAAGTVAHARSGDARRLCGRRDRSTVLGRHHQIASAPPPRSALRLRRPRKATGEAPVRQAA